MIYSVLLNIFFCVLLFVSCAQKQKIFRENVPLKESEVVIDYRLGHLSYSLRAVTNGEESEISTRQEKTVLASGNLNLSDFKDFAVEVEEKVDALLELRRSQSEKLNACKSSFKMSVRSNGLSKTVVGCRDGNDTVGVGQLIKKGEFYLLSSSSDSALEE